MAFFRRAKPDRISGGTMVVLDMMKQEAITSAGKIQFRKSAPASSDCSPSAFDLVPAGSFFAELKVEE
jgi:hypothetical protein